MRILHVCLPIAVTSAFLASCAPVDHSIVAESAPSLTVSGSLTMRERIGLSPLAVGEVKLLDASNPDAPMLARQVVPFNGRQVPIAFNLAVEQSRLRPDGNYVLHGTIQDGDGRAVWAVEKPVSPTPGAPRLDVGTLVVVRQQGSEDTPPTEATPYRARGNEPGWMVEFGSSELTFVWNTGQDRMTTPLPVAQPTSTGRRYQVNAEGKNLVIDVTDAICRDTMSGMTYPDTVTVTFNGSTLNGCGGQPASLLQGNEWTVESIAGAPVVPNSTVTLTFDNDGRVVGSGGCNRINMAYTLTGEGMSIEPGLRTQMACEDAILRQEDRFIDLLGKVQGFEIPEPGKLALVTSTDERIVARR